MRESKLNKTLQAKKVKAKSTKAKAPWCNCGQVKLYGHPLLHTHMADMKVNSTPKTNKVKARKVKARLIDRLAEAAKELSDSCEYEGERLFYSEPAKSKLDVVLAEFDKTKQSEAEADDKERMTVEKAMRWARYNKTRFLPEHLRGSNG